MIQEQTKASILEIFNDLRDGIEESARSVVLKEGHTLRLPFLGPDGVIECAVWDGERVTHLEVPVSKATGSYAVSNDSAYFNWEDIIREKILV